MKNTTSTNPLASQTAQSARFSKIFSAFSLKSSVSILTCLLISLGMTTQAEAKRKQDTDKPSAHKSPKHASKKAQASTAAVSKKSRKQARADEEGGSVRSKSRAALASKGSRGKQALVVRRGKNGRLIAERRADREEKVAVRKVVTIRGHRRVITTWVKPRAAEREVHVAAVPAVPVTKPSIAQMMGLRGDRDALDLKSSVALVVDQNTNEVLYEKNTHAVLPIASITKLMTATVVMDAGQPLNEVLQITDEDRDYEKGTSSRLQPGMQFTREELLRLALMSSENRAASALGRNYPGGKPAFVQAMNYKARELGMKDTHYVDSNGLSSKNVSSAVDLTRMVNAAYQHPLIRQFTTQNDALIDASGHSLKYVNTNRLVRSGDWEIGLQKTGFINEAGRCLVMQAKIQGRNVVMVFLDSAGKLSRFADAKRVRDWLEGAIGVRNADHTPVATLRAQPPI